MLLVFAGCFGFVTVADDLSHKGELFAVGGILLAGLVLLVDGSSLFTVRRLAPRWVAVGIGLGGAVGAAIDHVPMGIGCGALFGALGSAVMPRLWP
jgi:hypothetical protein